MKPTTKEQVKVTLLVDLEYETKEERDHLISKLKFNTPNDIGVLGRGYSMSGVNGSVTVSSNDESVIRAWMVRYKKQDPVIIRTTNMRKAQWIFASEYNLKGADPYSVTVSEAPEFTWNSQLIPGNVYSLEHAEAVNKKP